MFLDGIASLTANGDDDGPEPTIGALIRAIKASEEESPIIVFTDADASDPELLSDAQDLIAQKSVTVTFALEYARSIKRAANDKAQDIKSKHEQKRQFDDIYNIIAAFSGEFVGFSTDQSQVTILRESGNMLSTTFHVDSFIQQVVISIDGSGGGENVSVMTPAGNATFCLTSLNLQLCVNTRYFLSHRGSCIHLEHEGIFSVTTDIFFHSHLDNH